MPHTMIRPTFLGRFFGPIQSIMIKDQSIRFEYKNQHSKSFRVDQLCDFIQHQSHLLGSRLIFIFETESLSYSMLNKADCERLMSQLDPMIKIQLEHKIDNASQQLNILAVQQYLRDAHIDQIDQLNQHCLERYLNNLRVWQYKLDQHSLSQLEQLHDYFPLAQHSARLRLDYQQRQLDSRKDFLDQVESQPLTEQQRLAVIRNNDRNLILAAAGTGKTSVIVAKVLDLIDRGVANSDQILVLAYNNAAAKELQQRLQFRSQHLDHALAQLPTISTFHALGRQILKDSHVATYLSVFAQDPKLLEIWMSEWLNAYIHAHPNALLALIELAQQPSNAFDFQNQQDYELYIRDNEYRTLQGERVKGYQELLIANWLFRHGIAYQYEAPYVSKRRIQPGFDYCPDFYLPDADVYLEHFGVDRQGQTRADIDADQYQHEMQAKRELHLECKTILLETYHYDWVEGTLEQRLAQLMQQQQIELKPKSNSELFHTLNHLGILIESAKRYVKCLQAIRSEGLDKAAILARLQQHQIYHAAKYADLLDQIHQAYRQKLVQDQRIDFDDMILGATTLIQQGQFKPEWTHILVDEFQDISTARMNLIQALIQSGPAPILTAVGDDWQSIYRFSGAKLQLTTRFEALVGSHSLSKLEKTYRYNNSIADTAGRFVMQNPEQYRKQVTSQHQVEHAAVYLLDQNDPQLDTPLSGTQALAHRVLQCIQRIRRHDAEGTIAVLARYRYLLDQTQKTLRAASSQPYHLNPIQFWTFHGAKGLEADYCILIGFEQGKTGFPNQNQENAIVEALLPSLDSYPHAEERRLMYVAMTRAKKKCYLIADALAPSEFITELCAAPYHIHIASTQFSSQQRASLKCPHCSSGYFKRQQSKFDRPYYRCSSGSVCPARPRLCEKCTAPSIDELGVSRCQNAACGHQLLICLRCARPMKLRQGKHGQFWGCSGYALQQDQCKETRPYTEPQAELISSG